jgi:hypothetical protein
MSAVVDQSPDAAAPPTVDPRAEYVQRRDTSHGLEVRYGRLEAVLGNGRVVIFLAGLGLLYFIFGPAKISPAWLAVPGAVFLALVKWHERVVGSVSRARRAAAYYERGLERLDGNWAGKGEPGTRYLTDGHPYAPDLDIFGPGSLFERLSTARTRGGEDLLAQWLSGPAAPDEIRARQAVVNELRDRLGLREDLALFGADIPAGVDLAGLARWGSEPRILGGRWNRVAASLLVVLVIGTLAGWVGGELSVYALLAALALEGAFGLWYGRRVAQVIGPVGRKTHDLALFAGLLARIEREPFTTPRLQQIRAALTATGRPPSQRIAQLAQLVYYLDCNRNTYFALASPLVLWTTQLAFAFEAWRAVSGPHIGRWLAAVAEFEALGSLAAYAYENPADPFPEIVTAGPCFAGAALGHPLIPVARCVRNDVALGGELRVLVVSGSNMSGKSTLLRTVGINAVLALAGAPVRAKQLRLSPLAVGATLRIQDSLQAGKSRFYVEIQRVRQLMDLARGQPPQALGAGLPTPPLLFLLDEIFHGTNSHDRRIGAEAVVRSLADLGAIGLVTTHDLALTHIAEHLAPRAANVHFEDHLENGTISFDYRMRPGVVRNSNALALMRAVGLEV